MTQPPGQGLLGQARVVSEVRQQLRRRRWWELGPHVCVSTALGSSVAQLGRSKHTGGRRELTTAVRQDRGRGSSEAGCVPEDPWAT